MMAIIYQAGSVQVQQGVIEGQKRIVISVEGNTQSGFVVEDWISDPVSRTGYAHRTFHAPSQTELKKRFGIRIES